MSDQKFDIVDYATRVFTGNSASSPAMNTASPTEYPHPKCDEACYYLCTEAGAHPPSCQGSATSGEAADPQGWQRIDGHEDGAEFRERLRFVQAKTSGEEFDNLTAFIHRWGARRVMADRAALAASAEQPNTPVPRVGGNTCEILQIQYANGNWTDVGPRTYAEVEQDGGAVRKLYTTPVAERATTQGENNERVLPATSGSDAPAEHAIKGVGSDAGADAGAAPVAERAAAPASNRTLGLLREALAWISNSAEPAPSLCADIRRALAAPEATPASVPKDLIEAVEGIARLFSYGIDLRLDNALSHARSVVERIKSAAPEVAQPAAQGERAAPSEDLPEHDMEGHLGTKYYSAQKMREWGASQRQEGRREGIEEAAALFDTSPHADEFHCNIAASIRALKSLATPAPTAGVADDTLDLLRHTVVEQRKQIAGLLKQATAGEASHG